MERTGMIATKTCALLKGNPSNNSRYKLEWLYKGSKVGIKFTEGNDRVFFISPDLDYPVELITVRLIEFLCKEHIEVDSVTLALEETDEESYFS